MLLSAKEVEEALLPIAPPLDADFLPLLARAAFGAALTFALAACGAADEC